MMKRILVLFTILAMLFTMCACENKKTFVSSFKAQEISSFKIENELPPVQLETADYNAFLEVIDYNGIECPFSDLFGITEAVAEKASRVFAIEKHTYDFFEGASSVDVEKLYQVVKKNNEKYMEGISQYFNNELSDSKLRECCEIVADTLNWGISNIDGVDLAQLGCVLGNLKILNRGTMNLGTFNDKTNLLNISPDMIKSKIERTGNSDIYRLTVSHETMHILQCRCCDLIQAENDHFIGTSYVFESLEINPLKNSWLYEASAELNATLRLNSAPTTYQYMIDNLESISLATILNDNNKVRQLEKFSFTQDEASVYKQLEFEDETDAIEFLYTVELLRVKPEDFKAVYEREYAAVEDYDEFLKTTYNPYFVEVVSKLMYKNLAQKLTQNKMSLNDVFYIISLYELDLLKDIPLGNSVVRDKYREVYENYLALQNEFFNLIQKCADINVHDSFAEYSINFGEEELYANATLDWLDSDKSDYLLFRNKVLYDKSHKPILSY